MSDKADKPKTVEELKVPDEFYKIINDFITDILTTFPEYSGIVSRWWNRDEIEMEAKEAECLVVFRHCIKVFPERFFDILYKNTEIFSETSEENTEFLPGIVFKLIWSYNISDTTRETIWKYLQLILFSVIGSVHTTSELGDTAKLFEAINEEELKNKLQEAMENMSNIFDTSGNNYPTNLSLLTIPYLEYTIDPSGNLFGNTVCGTDNFQNYLVFNPPYTTANPTHINRL